MDQIGALRTTCRLLAAVLVCVLGQPALSIAQDGAASASAVSGRSVFSAPPSFGRAKRRQARESGEWTFSFVGGAAVGFDNNVHLGPDGAQRSLFESVNGGAEALYYEGRVHRLRLDIEASGLRFEKSSGASGYEIEGGFSYAFRPSDTYSLTLAASVDHESDSETSTIGEDLKRDFRHTAYRASVGGWWYPADGHAVRLSQVFVRRDYANTVGTSSLDWWKLGPRLVYRFDATETFQLTGRYDFTYQTYDEEPSGNAVGDEPPGSPAEEHYFHRAQAVADWNVSDDVELSFGYAFKRKDDQFENFESYSSHRSSFEIDWAATERLFVGLDMDYTRRYYDERPASAQRNLEYDRWRADLEVSYRLTDSLYPFVAYALDRRETNRTLDARTFRDYAHHTVMVGVTAAY